MALLLYKAKAEHDDNDLDIETAKQDLTNLFQKFAGISDQTNIHDTRQ